ncbi:hypothetical protein MTO96_031463 [Rhipicephalus appendiculatus]
MRRFRLAKRTPLYLLPVVAVVIIAVHHMFYVPQSNREVSVSTSTSGSLSFSGNAWMHHYTLDMKAVDRFIYGSAINGSEFPPMHVVFVVPGCQSPRSTVSVIQLGHALDSLLQHTSRPLHVDVLMASRHRSNDVALLLECLRPNTRHGVSAVVDLYQLQAERRKLEAMNITLRSDDPQRGFLFPLCTCLHRLLRVQRVLLLAPEVQFHYDVSFLWAQFEQFPAEAVFGLAWEQGPRYARLLKNRSDVAPKQGGCGDPPTVGGNPGLNGAVALLNLGGMRQSREYARLYSEIDDIAEKHGWSGGPLADHDFYTMASCEVPALLHLLPCAWNRQVPGRQKAPVISRNGAVRADSLYRWCEGGLYACSAHCPED